MLNVVKTLSRHVRIGVECEQFLVGGITRNWRGRGNADWRSDEFDGIRTQSGAIRDFVLAIEGLK
jgi:hypothetical protein